jgi:NADH dehydrogenase
VIGDQASVRQGGRTLPGLAPVAMQEGRAVADSIIADLSGRARAPFTLVDKGQMATIGRSRAVAETGRLKFTGLIAWLMWLFVHIYYLIGFKNRVVVLFQWFWAYITFKRGAFLILNKEWRSYAKSDRTVVEEIESLT